MDGDERDVPGVHTALLLLPWLPVRLVVATLLHEVGLSESEAAHAVRAARAMMEPTASA